MRAALTLLVTLAIAACTRAGSPDDARPARSAPAPSQRIAEAEPAPAPDPAPAPTPTPGPEPAPPPGPDAACAVEYRLQVDGYAITATATNLGGEDAIVQLADRCPAGPLALLGLPDGYDADRTCNMGDCAGGRAASTPRPIGAGATVELARWTIDPAKGTCNAPLPAGTYALSFAPPPLADGGRTCGPAPVELTHGGKAKPPRKPAKKPAEAPRCKPMPACGIGCPGGRQARDEHGCTLCACEKLDVVAPVTR